MATLPLIVTVTSAPAGLVSRTTVSAGYTLQGQLKSSGVASFDFRGGTFTGFIESDPLGGFPVQAEVAVSVDYSPESGLTGFTKSLTVPVTAAGAHVFYDVPKQLDRVVMIGFAFGLNKDEKVQVRWDQLVAGVPVRGDALVVAGVLGADGARPIPAQLLVTVKAQPEQPNAVRLRVLPLTDVLHKTLDPFDQSFPVEAQSVVLTAEAVTATDHLRLVAQSF